MTQHMSSESLATQLLQNPFDHNLRLRYAKALLHEEKFPETLVQAELLISQSEMRPHGLQLKIEVLFELDRLADAEVIYREWRQLVGVEVKSEWDNVFANKRNLIVLSKEEKVVEEDGDRKKEEAPPRRPSISFQDVVGMSEVKEELRLKIIHPFKNPEIFAKYKKVAGGGIILFGPPGCGKTLLARAIATECQAEFIDVRISDILSRWLGESEANLASFFKKARARRPSVLFFDELDAIAISRSRTESSNIRTLIDEFLTQLDGFSADNENILLLGATNMPWDIDPAMKRSGRFSRQIFLPPPDAESRAEMLRIKLDGIPCDKINFKKLADVAEHYSGADIDGVVDLAKEKALSAFLKSGVETPVKEIDLIDGIKRTTPAAKDWLETVRNLVKYAGGDSAYQDVEVYLKKHRLL